MPSPVNSMPAMLADVKVDRMPQKKDEKESLTTSPERFGESWEKMPIWMPSEPRLPKPCWNVLANRRVCPDRI
jgi:hypothetical protein